MIISASYKTDIPAFYGKWFMNRLRAGYCKMVNPWNRNQIIRVPLERHAVDGIVFWTKNIGPFVDSLKEVNERGYPFIIQYTINNYPKSLEFSVVNANRSVENFKRISGEYGAKTCVWRYDTIVISSETPNDFHRRNFATLCRSLEGTTDEVVISFVHFYDKTLRNMNWAANEFGFEWEEPPAESKQELATEMVAMAAENGMRLSICSQPDFLVPGAVEARCVDAGRLEAIAGKPIPAELKGGRKECGCFASRDIGEYDTCPHGCVYCYAVRQRKLAQRRFHEHDPESEFLFPVTTSTDQQVKRSSSEQLTLFDDESQN